MTNLSPEKTRHPKPSDFVPDIQFSDDHSKWPGANRCQSWNYNEGRQCKAPAVKSKKRCKAHGGLTPGGLASPHTKTGLYSAYLPIKLSTQYENLLTMGQDLFKIDDETAALTTLIQEQLTKIEIGESGAAWGKIQSLYDEMAILGQKLDKSPVDVQRFNALFLELGKVINDGSMAYTARNEAVGLMEQKRKLVADERKDWAAKHQAMSFDRVMLILTAMAASFKQSLEKHILDDKNRRSILTDTQKFLDRVISE